MYYICYYNDIMSLSYIYIYTHHNILGSTRSYEQSGRPQRGRLGPRPSAPARALVGRKDLVCLQFRVFSTKLYIIYIQACISYIGNT